MRQGKYKLAPAEQKPSDFPPISGSFSSQANYKGKDSFLSIGRMHRKKTRRSGHFRCPLRRVKAALFGLFAVLQGAQLRAEILQLHGADLQVGQTLRRSADRPALHQTAVILPGLRRGGGVEAQRRPALLPHQDGIGVTAAEVGALHPQKADSVPGVLRREAALVLLLAEQQLAEAQLFLFGLAGQGRGGIGGCFHKDPSFLDRLFAVIISDLPGKRKGEEPFCPGLRAESPCIFSNLWYDKPTENQTPHRRNEA